MAAGVSTFSRFLRLKRPTGTVSHPKSSTDSLLEIPPTHTLPDVCEMEGRLPKLYGDDAVEIPGARALLDNLRAQHAPWAIVTSGTQPLVNGWLGVLNLPKPKHLISAESVAEGKPNPACYNMGREALQLTGEHTVLVLEDSPAGIHAGKDAGCKVLGLVTSHTAKQVAKAAPDWIVQDLASVRVVAIEAQSNGGVQTTLEFSNLLVLPSEA